MNLSFAAEAAVSVFREAGRVSLDLFRIMIPILILVKLLQEMGWIAYLALPLNPMMKIVGLPPEMGLVWATALVNNIYGAAIVFLSLSPELSLTSAQVTVLSTMILVAHALPVEVKIAQESGNRFLFQAFIRVGGALLLGFILHWLYYLTGWLQQENVIFWQGEISKTPGLLVWGLDQLRNLGFIFCVILALIILLRVFNRLGITEILIRLLQPLLRFMGIGREAAPLTIVGMTMGLTYGGGLIIRESKSGRVEPRDVFASVTLMGLTHSLVEDTLLMFMLGGHLSGILAARLIFSLLVVAALVRGLGRMSDSFVHRFLFKLPVQTEAVPGPEK
ncbi:MAG: hypothetical protein ACOC7W_10145 [Desulfosalsimonas sp.]